MDKFRRNDPPLITRMSGDAVLQLVHEAIRQTGSTRQLSLIIAAQPGGRNTGVWIVREATVGSWWYAEVEDATGALLKLERQGLR